jgi:hypothetical protein
MQLSDPPSRNTASKKMLFQSLPGQMQLSDPCRSPVRLLDDQSFNPFQGRCSFQTRRDGPASSHGYCFNPFQGRCSFQTSSRSIPAWPSCSRFNPFQGRCSFQTHVRDDVRGDPARFQSLPGQMQLSDACAANATNSNDFAGAIRAWCVQCNPSHMPSPPIEQEKQDNRRQIKTRFPASIPQAQYDSSDARNTEEKKIRQYSSHPGGAPLHRHAPPSSGTLRTGSKNACCRPGPS